MQFPDEWARYTRHEGMIGLDAQRRISATTVVVAGLGGIGGPAALLCAKAGFGRLVICDRDRYELANIVEQLFAASDTVGQEKTAAATRELRRHNPYCEVIPMQREIRTETDAIRLMAGAEYVISGVDEPFARIVLSRAACSHGVPFLIPANIGWSVLYGCQMPSGSAL